MGDWTSIWPTEFGTGLSRDGLSVGEKASCSPAPCLGLIHWSSAFVISVSGICKQHHGFITAESNITFPRNKKEFRTEWSTKHTKAAWFFKSSRLKFQALIPRMYSCCVVSKTQLKNFRNALSCNQKIISFNVPHPFDSSCHFLWRFQSTKKSIKNGYD